MLALNFSMNCSMGSGMASARLVLFRRRHKFKNRCPESFLKVVLSRNFSGFWQNDFEQNNFHSAARFYSAEWFLEYTGGELDNFILGSVPGE
jgi:hypothetical protein